MIPQLARPIGRHKEVLRLPASGRTVVLGTLAMTALIGVALASCRATNVPCSPSSCSGCCAGDVCVEGGGHAACGRDGRACVACGSNEACAAGSCSAADSGLRTCPAGQECGYLVYGPACDPVGFGGCVGCRPQPTCAGCSSEVKRYSACRGLGCNATCEKQATCDAGGGCEPLWYPCSGDRAWECEDRRCCVYEPPYITGTYDCVCQ